MTTDLVFGLLPEAPLPAGAVHLVFNAPGAGGSGGSSTDEWFLPHAGMPWRSTVPVGAATGGAPWRSAREPAAGRTAAAWGRPGASTGARGRLPWRVPDGPYGTLARLPWQSTDPVPGGPHRAVWGRSGPLGQSWRLPWSAAEARGARGSFWWGRAADASRFARLPWERAEDRAARGELPWGRALGVPSPVFHGPTYEGSLGHVPLPRPGWADLHFCVPAGSSSTDLVFGFEQCVRLPAAHLIIPSQRSYVLTHSIQALRLPDLAPVPLTALNIDADAGSYCWSFSGTGPEEVLTMLDPVTGPVALRIILDGEMWEFVIESARRTREFGATTVTVTGRSASALLGEPYVPVVAYLNAVDANAHAILDDILAYTGVSLDWRISDWVVPTGAWSFAGTPIAAICRIAEAAGAVVQSPRVGDQIIVRPRYDVLPWDWAATTPDVTIALDAVVSEGFARADRPPYEGVYLSAEAQGILALVKRAGTAPALLMPLVTDPLMNDSTVALQRGSALLGQAGPQANMTVTLPVLPSAGVIDCGKLVEIGAWRGVVRAVRVAVEGPTVRQTLTIERHL